MFIFSVDFPTPLWLGEDFTTGVSIGEAVFVVQNAQTEMRTGLYCGWNPIFSNGRNPIAPLLLSIATSLTGLTDSHTDSQLKEVSTAPLCGQSPVFLGLGVSRPSYSMLDVVSCLFYGFLIFSP